MTSPPAPSSPRPFPVPDEFGFEWPAPELALLTFQQDRMHVPYPQTPMSAWWAQRFAVGFNNGLRANSVPMRVDVLRLNTYYYMGVNPAVTPEELPALEGAAVAALQQAMARNAERWEQEWLPELRRGWDEWARRDLTTANDTDLAEHVRAGEEWFKRIWSIHFELLIPMMLGASLFEETYVDLFPDRPPLTAYRLLQGVDNMSLEAGRELWLIAREVSKDPTFTAVIRDTPVSELWQAIGANPAMAGIKARIDAYLNAYGRRSDNVQELATVSWTEDPSPALSNLKAYIGDASDPREMLAAQAAERDAYLEEIRAALAGYPQAARDAFEGLLAVAQHFGRIQEDHNFWIDQRGVHEMRQLCLALGNRLVERGILSDRDDIFLLDMEEALAALQGTERDLTARIRERRAEMEHYANIPAPPIVGMDYGPPPDNPVMRAMFRFFGGPPPAAVERNEIRGNTGSPGKVTGTARIVMTIAEGSKVEKGDILVAPTTAPPWTPLFGTAAGIVTETGGVLSHCAIVAREYGIPAVVGAPGATQLIPDGARIEVDGDSGTVRLLT